MKTILVLAANPKDMSQSRLQQEIREIENGLQQAKKRDEFIIKSVGAARQQDVRRAMLNQEPYIVHFCGHGSMEEGLAFENESGSVQFVTSEALARFFELFANKIECVVLNACYSESQAQAIAKHVSYVIGMKKDISDDAATQFATAFYDALGAGESFEFAYKVACNAIQWANLSEEFTPVLYSLQDTSSENIEITSVENKPPHILSTMVGRIIIGAIAGTAGGAFISAILGLFVAIFAVMTWAAISATFYWMVSGAIVAAIISVIMNVTAFSYRYSESIGIGRGISIVIAGAVLGGFSGWASTTTSGSVVWAGVGVITALVAMFVVNDIEFNRKFENSITTLFAGVVLGVTWGTIGGAVGLMVDELAGTTIARTIGGGVSGTILGGIWAAGLKRRGYIYDSVAREAIGGVIGGIIGGIIILASGGLFGLSPVDSTEYLIILVIGGIVGTVLGIAVSGDGDVGLKLVGSLGGLLIGAIWGAFSRTIWNLARVDPLSLKEPIEKMGNLQGVAVFDRLALAFLGGGLDAVFLGLLGGLVIVIVTKGDIVVWVLVGAFLGVILGMLGKVTHWIFSSILILGMVDDRVLETLNNTVLNGVLIGVFGGIITCIIIWLIKHDAVGGLISGLIIGGILGLLIGMIVGSFSEVVSITYEWMIVGAIIGVILGSIAGPFWDKIIQN